MRTNEICEEVFQQGLLFDESFTKFIGELREAFWHQEYDAARHKLEHYCEHLKQRRKDMDQAFVVQDSTSVFSVFSEHTANALYQGGFQNVASVAKATDAELLLVPNVAMSTLNVIRKVVPYSGRGQDLASLNPSGLYSLDALVTEDPEVRRAREVAAAERKQLASGIANGWKEILKEKRAKARLQAKKNLVNKQSNKAKGAS